MTVPAHDKQGPAPAPAPEGLVQRVVRWLRAGYPEGVPQQDYVALLGILRRTLTPDELDRVTAELTEQAEAGMAIMTPQLVAQRITEVVLGPAHGDDLVRVSARLAAAGWPLWSPAADDADSSDVSSVAGVSATTSTSGASGAPAEGGASYDGLGRLEADGDGDGVVTRVVDWLRAGYPTGLPDRDFVPLVALLRRRLTDDEVRLVARRLVETGVLPVDHVDIGAAIAKVTTELPSEEDVSRVRQALAEHGSSTDFPG